MTNNILQRGIRKAMKSSCRYKIVAIGFNSKGELIALKTNRPRFKRQGGSIHAEMALMRGFGKRIVEMKILRVGQCGNLMKIDPCNTCLEKATELGIKIT